MIILPWLHLVKALLHNHLHLTPGPSFFNFSRYNQYWSFYFLSFLNLSHLQPRLVSTFTIPLFANWLMSNSSLRGRAHFFRFRMTKYHICSAEHWRKLFSLLLFCELDSTLLYFHLTLCIVVWEELALLLAACICRWKLLHQSPKIVEVVPYTYTTLFFCHSHP